MKNILLLKPYFLFLILILLLSCNSNHKIKKQEIIKNKNITIPEIAFKKSLLTELKKYMDKNKEIENPWKAPIIYIVSFNKSKRDTTIEIRSHIGLICSNDSTRNADIKPLQGISYLNNHPVVVYDFISMNNDFFGMIDKNLLNKDSLEAIKFRNPNKINAPDWVCKAPSWNYKIINSDSLVRIKK